MNEARSMQPLEAKLGEILRQRCLKLATAESCTGGLIGHKITNIPGSSEYYLGGVVSYAYEAKVKLLGVRWQTLEQYGAVSRETVLEMASGVRAVLDADLGLAVSGIAGPGGATPTKPVGLTWIGLSSAAIQTAWSEVFKGDREQIKDQACQKALALIIAHLEYSPPQPLPTLMKSMLPIQVIARSSEDGQPTPLQFSWEGQNYLIASSGRRWVDEAGQHILVMDYQNQVIELVFDPGGGNWFLADPAKLLRKA